MRSIPAYRWEKEESRRTHQAVKGQADIDLAFHTPASVSSWISRWSDSQLHHTELEIMFYRWSERFPPLKSLDRLEMAGQPLWRQGAEAMFLSDESTEVGRGLDRWMVPNKLPALRPVRCGAF
nr:plasmid SOS inhibition protein A [Pantoea varia]